MKIYLWLCLLGAALLVVGCSGGGGSDTGPVQPGVSSLTISPNQTVVVGQTAQLAFTARNSAGQDVTSQIRNNVVWSSSNSGVLSVNGLSVTGVSQGTANVAVSYLNQNGQQVNSPAVAVTVLPAGSGPQARAFSSVPVAGPYEIRFVPDAGAPVTITSSVSLGNYSSFVTLPTAEGSIRAFEDGVQRSSRTLTLEPNTTYTFVVGGTPTNTVIVPVREKMGAITAGEFRLRFVMGYFASRRTYDIYLLRPGQTVNDVEPVRTNRAFETGFTEDYAAGIDRFALTVPGTKTVAFTGTFESPAGSNVILVVDETSADTYRFQYWGTTS